MHIFYIIIIVRIENENEHENPPPEYDYDIIDRQPINTFGTTQAPNGYVFGSVVVQKNLNQHTERTFNDTDLTTEQIEDVALLDTGTEVHTCTILQEQPADQGALILDNSLTILKYGKYNFRGIGTYTIEKEPQTNNWVIPVVMNIDIQLERPNNQNQVVEDNGIMELIQGLNGLQITPYNNNNRVRGNPNPSQGLSLGTFTVNVPQTLVNNYTQSTITTNGTYTIPNGYTGFNDFIVNVPTTTIYNYNPYPSDNRKEITVNGSGSITFNSSNYTGLDNVYYNVNVSPSFFVNNNNLTDSNTLTYNLTKINNGDKQWINISSSMTLLFIKFNTNDWTLYYKTYVNNESVVSCRFTNNTGDDIYYRFVYSQYFSGNIYTGNKNNNTIITKIKSGLDTTVNNLTTTTFINITDLNITTLDIIGSPV